MSAAPPAEPHVSSTIARSTAATRPSRSTSAGAKQSALVSLTQVASQAVSQQKASSVQTVTQQSASAQAGVACSVVQAPAVGEPQTDRPGHCAPQ